MKWILKIFLSATLLGAPLVKADVPNAARSADVVFLGEVHDNPAHHALQALWVRELAPVAIVFEMLPRNIDQNAVAASLNDPENLAHILEWETRGWPEFTMYYPIFEAAPAAEIRGAEVPRDQVRGLMDGALAQAFGPRSDLFGLDIDLPKDQQAARETLQSTAHCDALPISMLPMMVNVQRLRDAVLADAVLSAHNDLAKDLSGPVVVITGNGHARKDWGAPSVLARSAPELVQFSLGQSESGQPPNGTFDLVIDAPAVERADPCEAFRTKS